MVLAVIFDRDGVLTDFGLQHAIAVFESQLPVSVADLSQRFVAWERVSRQAGFPSTLVEEQHYFHGFWDRLSDDLKLPPETRSALHQVSYTDFLIPYPDARPALELARSQSWRIGVLSNFSLVSLPRSLVAVGLSDLIDVALSSSIIGAAKPDPRAYRAMADALLVDPEQCLFFDDEVDCVRGAAQVGMQAFQVDRHLKQHRFEQRQVRDLSALSTILKTLQ